MVSEVALAMLSIAVIMLGVGSCIYNTILLMKMSALVERHEKMNNNIISVLRSAKGRRK